MSKFVKNLISNHVGDRLKDVDNALLVNVIGLDANCSVRLRRVLREKEIELMVVKNSLARRATEGTALSAVFAEIEGPCAIVWGSEDVVSLAKEVVKLAEDKEFEGFEPRGGVMDGAPLTADQVRDVSKWPSRSEQLSLLVGQILGPGATLAAQVGGPGGTLAGQIKQKSEEEEESA